MSDRYSVYVLQGPTCKLYIGFTNELARRLKQHNAGQSKWTKGKGPWRIVWKSEMLSLSEARKLENKLKRQKGSDGFYRFTGLSRSAVNPAAAGS
jgi:putative endonuclease